MKLDVAVNEATLSGTGTTGEFRIRNSAKAFKILSDGLYSNKIRAIIRELSCNALDSHVAAGKVTTPFEVHLPTLLEPWFAVRDFGVGLSGDQVTSIYTTYFESTKTDSNDYIGALGLGSKSPFSYTENFTVTAIKDGMQRIYSAFINEMGVPCVAEMSVQLTDEANGVEVKFSVTDRYDYNSFRHEAQNVFQWFKHPPKITGVDNFTITMPDIKERDIVPGVHSMAYERNGSLAVMGNICYPLAKIPEPTKHFGELANLLHCGLIIEFEIGELDFAASREELSYVPLTLKSIKKRLELLNANLALHLAKKADEYTNEWKRAAYLRTQARSSLYKAAVVKYVADTKFELYDPKSYSGTKTFNYAEDKFNKMGFSIIAFTASGGGTNRSSIETKGYNHTTNKYELSYNIPVDDDAVFVLNDLKIGCSSRAKYHYMYHNNGKRVSVYCVSHPEEDLVERQKLYDKFMKELHNPPEIVKASTLQKPPAKEKQPTQGIMILQKRAGVRAGYEDSYSWNPYEEELDENVVYHYVKLRNYQAMNKDGTQTMNIHALKACMDVCGVPAIGDIPIFGVRMGKIKELEDLDNWVWFEEKLKEEINKVSDKTIVSLVAAELLDHYNGRVYTNKTVANSVGPDSDYAKFMAEYGGVTRASGNVTQLISLCKEYGKSLQVDKVRNEITNAKNTLYKKYPLLEHLTHASVTDVADYIKLVDKQ
jgi:hypothetical protein